MQVGTQGRAAISAFSLISCCCAESELLAKLLGVLKLPYPAFAFFRCMFTVPKGSAPSGTPPAQGPAPASPVQPAADPARQLQSNAYQELVLSGQFRVNDIPSGIISPQAAPSSPALRRRQGAPGPPVQLKLQERGVTAKFIKDFLHLVQTSQGRTSNSGGPARVSFNGGPVAPPRTSNPGGVGAPMSPASRASPSGTPKTSKSGNTTLSTAEVVKQFIKPATAHNGMSFVEAVMSRDLDLAALPAAWHTISYSKLQASIKG